MIDYLRDPAEIYRRSFEIIREEIDVSGVPDSLRDVVVRIVHAAGATDVAADLLWGGEVVAASRQALAAGAPIFVDSRMVSAGIVRRFLPCANAVECCLYDEKTTAKARALGTTKSAAAVDLWGDRIAGALVVIGNAPTALFRLIERINEGGPRPAAVFGFPVGFVGAAEAKQALAEAGWGIPFLTLRGRRGGSAVAAAAVNALGRSSA